MGRSSNQTSDAGARVIEDQFKAHQRTNGCHDQVSLLEGKGKLTKQVYAPDQRLKDAMEFSC